MTGHIAGMGGHAGLEYAVILHEKPMMLLHPDSYSQNLKNAIADATGGVIPKVIEGIQILQ